MPHFKPALCFKGLNAANLRVFPEPSEIFNQGLVSRCTKFVIAAQSLGVNLSIIRINFEALDFLA
jgi:hypothetical protein